jgi:hypothetical protein
MAKVESPRDAALRRVVHQEARIAKQKRLIANLKANGSGTGAAKQLLALMEDSLTALRTSLSIYR